MSTKPTFAAAKKFVPPTLRHTFLRTRVTVSDSGADLDAGGAAKKLGAPLFVVTAWNPGSRQLGLDENRERNERLTSELSEANREWADAVGSDPSGPWREESFALIGCGRKAAAHIARAHGQLAFFEINAERLTVRGVDNTFTLSRQHGETPLPLTQHTLGESTGAALGFGVTDQLKRFRRTGWLHLGPTELPCPTCKTPHELFSNIREQRSGSIVEHLAVVCPQCRTARPTTKLPGPRRIMIERWRDHLRARADAETHPDQHTRCCYVIGLDIDGPGGDPVYVGETSKSPEERFEQHRNGHKASPVVRKFGTALRHDLMIGLPVHRSRVASETYEVYLGAKLNVEGYLVHGAH